MKAVCLLKKIIFIIFMFHTINLLFCETNTGKGESDYQFRTGISASMLYGTSFELVYQTEDKLLSELRWDMKPLFHIGSFLEYSLKDPAEKVGFYGNIGLKAGFPAKTGFMEDRDWLSAEYGLSHFSKHDNDTNASVLLDMSLGLSIPVVSALVIRPLLSFHYMHHKWTAYHGYFQYGENISDGVYEAWDDSIPKTYLHGSVVGYSQDWLIFSVGTSAQFSFLKRCILEGSFLYSPLILVYATDDHYLTNTQYRDTASGGYLLEPAAAFSFIFNQKMRLSLKASYRYIHDSKGHSYEYPRYENVLQGKSNAGAEYEVWDIGITFSYGF